MRLLLPTLSLAFAAAVAAPAARAMEAPTRHAIPGESCSVVLMQMLAGEDPIRPTAETGGIPCPQYLSTVAIQRPRAPQRT